MHALIYSLNVVLTTAFDWLQWGLSWLGEWGELAVWAALLGALGVRVWARFADQEEVRRRRERLQGDILAVRLFQNDLRVFGRTQGRILWDAFAYLRGGIRPALILAIPVGLCLVQFEGRYALRPLRPGEPAVVAVGVTDGALLEGEVSLEADEGIEVETSGVRDRVGREIVWRIRARETGTHRLAVRAGERVAEKEVVVGPVSRFISASRVGEGWLERLLHPGEPPLDTESGLGRVTVEYPERAFVFWGWRGGWWMPFFILVFASGYALKQIWKVEI